MLYKRSKLVNNLLLLEGITRSGKFLLGNIVSCFDRVEHYMYYGLLEHVPMLVRMNLMNEDVACGIVQCEIDNFVYDYMVGRNLNFRYEDKSSILSYPGLHDCIYRMNNGVDVEKEIDDNTLVFPFIMHDCLCNLHMFFKLYPELRVVHIDRSPVSLVFSWFNRGLGNRWGVDLKEFSLVLDNDGFPVPWFAWEWKDFWKDSCEMDRIIKSVLWLDDMNKVFFSSLADEYKAKVFFVRFEELLSDPNFVVRKLGYFLDRTASDLFKVLNYERLPNKDFGVDIEKKVKFIEDNAGSDFFDLVMKTEDDYKL